MASTGGPFTCSVCGAKFKFRKHLQRHHVTHSAERPHKCGFCDARFKRRDVLRKHLKTCTTRLALGQEMPEETLPGKPFKSCDHCAVSKKACDQTLPCATCVSRNQACTYNRAAPSVPTASASMGQSEVEQDTLDASPDFGFDFVENSIVDRTYSPSHSLVPEWWSWVQEMPFLSENESLDSEILRRNLMPPFSPWQSQQGSKFNFLLNFTRTSGLQRVFNYSRPRRESSASLYLSADGDDSVMASEGTALPNRDFRTSVMHDINPWLQDCQADFSNLAGSHNLNSSQVEVTKVVQWLDDPLFARTKELWGMFRPHLPLLSKSTSDQNEYERSDGSCLQFLSPPKIKRFAEFFFDQWYPHCPILHEPTFNLATVPALLLAPVILMGACMSDVEEERVNGRLYAGLVETMVFSHSLLSLYSSSALGDGLDISPIKVMQAAYLVCLLQNWEGNDTAKKRIRQNRFVTLIAAARDTGFSCSNHGFDMSKRFEWKSFIEREEAIRTFTYIFLLDSAFLIFNNAPPKLMLQELEMDLACPEGVFQAESAEACYNLWQSSQLEHSDSGGTLSLVKAIEFLAAPEFSRTVAENFSRMTTLNLFTIISGIHVILFQHRTLFLCPPTNLNQIRITIERWKVAWGARNGVACQDSMLKTWQEPGFIRHADEFARLALGRLNNLEEQRKQQQQPSASAHLTGQTGFERLDETSMSQVTALMLSLAVADD